MTNYLNLYTLILGISGGQYSTLTGKLCQIAIKELNNQHKSKKYCFIAVNLPYGNFQID